MDDLEKYCEAEFGLSYMRILPLEDLPALFALELFLLRTGVGMQGLNVLVKRRTTAEGLGALSAVEQ